MPVLPRGSRLNEVAAHLLHAKEHRKRSRDELRAVVATKEPRRRPVCKKLFENSPNPQGLEVGANLQGQALAREFVLDRKDLESGPVQARIKAEVDAPKVIGPGRLTGNRAPGSLLSVALHPEIGRASCRERVEISVV